MTCSGTATRSTSGETCDTPDAPATLGGAPRAELPDVITNVSTTDATVPDTAMTTPIHATLDRRGLLPGEHYLDSGYPTAALVGDCLRQYGITLVSPLLADHSPQAKAGAGYDRASFTLDFECQQAICPQHQTSSWWTPANQRGTDVVTIKSAASTCGSCPVREHCTRSISPKLGRQLTVPPWQVHHAQLAARVEQNTNAWRARYAIRAGVEGTIRQGVAVCGMRHARYRGLPRTHLEHVYSASVEKFNHQGPLCAHTTTKNISCVASVTVRDQ